MSRAELTTLTLTRFKTHRGPSTLILRPLTVVIGRNNSGKSSLIQSLLLLKQTLDHRQSIPLYFEEGIVDAFSLSDLTWGWPAQENFDGPEIELTLRSEVDLRQALGDPAAWPELKNLKKLSGIDWLRSGLERVTLTTGLRLNFQSSGGKVVLGRIELVSQHEGKANPSFVTSAVMSEWNGKPFDTADLAVEIDHFLPVLRLDLEKIGPRNSLRSYYHGFRVLYDQPLEDLRRLLRGFAYLSSNRDQPRSIYRPVTTPSLDLGVNGEEAARIVHSRQKDLVRYLAPVLVSGDQVSVDTNVRAAPLFDATRDVMRDLGISDPLRLEDVKGAGFRVLFGKANLPHVGRGVAYLLPTVVLGLMLDPTSLPDTQAQSVAEYLAACDRFPHAAIEEAEIHLHPKVQSRLAHWLVSLGMSGRRFVVETHSDHLVRRLRGLIARATPGSPLEVWLSQNVVIAEVEQGPDGAASVRCSHLTREGAIESWPAEFMDESAEEERAIYSKLLEKTADRDALQEAEARFVDRDE